MAKQQPLIRPNNHRFDQPYTREQQDADRRAIDAALRPLNEAVGRRTGMTREEAIRIARAFHAARAEEEQHGEA